MKIAIKPLILLILLLAVAVPGFAAPDPVKWSARLEPGGIRAGEGGRVVLTATIEPGWHVYSMKPVEGPFPTQISMAPHQALVAVGKPVQPPGERVHDQNFGVDVEYYEGAVAFSVPVKVAAGATGAQKAVVAVKYQTCNAKLCLPPKPLQLPVAFTIAAGAARPDHAKADTSVPPQPPGAKGSVAGSTTGASAPAAAPVATDAVLRRIQEAQKKGLLAFLWLALSFGFLALLTPCVFPMVPITVSFFSKQGKTRREGIEGAVAYCAGIIGTFTALGLVLSLVFGAGRISGFATNAYVNIALAVLFVILAVNLFGVFEIALPATLVNRVQSGSRRGRLLGPLLGGLAFTLTSFTCTVPFVGTVLASATTGNLLWPLAGMLAFSAAFASPFFLLALFPQWLARLPKSGPWLVSVKAFMGFLELAAALKFLSNADLVWQAGLLTRPVFLAIWAAIGAIAGLYLLGWLRLPHDAVPLRPGIGRRALGIGTVALGIYCLSGINGRALGELDSFLPPLGYGPGARAAGLEWVKDYDTAVKRAAAEGKPLFLNFTGFTCTNCRWMEANMFTRPEVASELSRFVPVELYTDGVGPDYERNKALEEQRFGTVALPLYAVVSPDGQRPLGESPGLTRDTGEFLRFLRQSHNAATQVAERSPER